MLQEQAQSAGFLCPGNLPCSVETPKLGEGESPGAQGISRMSRAPWAASSDAATNWNACESVLANSPALQFGDEWAEI